MAIKTVHSEKNGKPSITSWTRLESRTRSEDFQTSIQAQIHDPLWLLARQWQLGEYQGQDGGSPVSARIRTESAALTRYRPGTLKNETTETGEFYDVGRQPLETLVERERIRPTNANIRPNWRLAAEAGLHFLRLLDRQGVGQYRNAFVEHYAIQMPSDEERRSLDQESQRFLIVMARRIPDGHLLHRDLSLAIKRQPATLPEAPAIDTQDRQQVMQAADAWIAWYRTNFSEPANDESPWIPERLEYSFAVSARTADGEAVLMAEEYQEGHLDWYNFNLQPSASLGAANDPEPIEGIHTVMPAPVRYKGKPADRWWEFEDAQVFFGGVETNPEDLSQLLLIQFALTYGNDWFMVPIELNLGSIHRIRSLVITDTFGQRMLIRPSHEVDGLQTDWRMYSPSVHRRSDNTGVDPSANMLFLPPVLATSLHSASVEEVRFLRDEMANMAWAVERVVESSIGAPLNRFEVYQETRQHNDEEQESIASETDDHLAYRLSTRIPDYWTPLLPVKVNKGSPEIRLQRGGLLRDKLGEPVTPEPQGRILEPGKKLSLFEEEVPRTGVHVTRAYQYSRWTDGSTHLWMSRRKVSGRGEGWSGLRFDIVEEE